MKHLTVCRARGEYKAKLTSLIPTASFDQINFFPLSHNESHKQTALTAFYSPLYRTANRDRYLYVLGGFILAFLHMHAADAGG